MQIAGGIIGGICLVLLLILWIVELLKMLGMMVMILEVWGSLYVVTFLAELSVKLLTMLHRAPAQGLWQGLVNIRAFQGADGPRTRISVLAFVYGISAILDVGVILLLFLLKKTPVVALISWSIHEFAKTHSRLQHKEGGFTDRLWLLLMLQIGSDVLCFIAYWIIKAVSSASDTIMDRSRTLSYLDQQNYDWAGAEDIQAALHHRNAPLNVNREVFPPEQLRPEEEPLLRR